MRNRLRLFALGLASAGCVLAALPVKDAQASFIDVGVQGGVMGRTLADQKYKPGFSLQLHADLALLPPILMVGAYVDGFPFGGKLTPDNGNIGDPHPVTFIGGGLRAKLKIPLPGPFTPYGFAGIGMVHGDFPDQQLTICKTIGGVSGCAPTQTVPSATALFGEVLLGAGAMIDITGPLKFTLEGSWRPSFGYKNDVYEQQVQSQSTQAPPPSRNGYAWTFHAGLDISF